MIANVFMMCSVLHANGMFFHIMDTAYERAWELGLAMNLESDHPNNVKMIKIIDFLGSNKGIPFCITIVAFAQTLFFLIYTLFKDPGYVKTGSNNVIDNICN